MNDRITAAERIERPYEPTWGEALRYALLLVVTLLCAHLLGYL